MNLKEKFINKPNPYIVLGIFVFSVTWIYISIWNNETVVLAENNIFEGRVVKIISEEERPTLSGQRANIEQQLSVEVDFGGEKKIKTVLNDFVPIGEGDEVCIQASAPDEPEESYSVMDIKRQNGLIWLAILFVLLVGAVSGKRGLYALVGLLFSFAVIFLFIIPNILSSSNTISISLAGALLILFVSLYVSHGFNKKSLSALFGISITLFIVGFIANYSVELLHFSGFSGEESVYLNAQTDNSLSLVSLLVIGILIAVIGILDDIAVTQASIVFRLALANNELRGWKLFREAMEVGRDHISAVINTLALAYAGASLPLLLLLSLNNFPLGFIINGEIIAEEIARTLISSSGLILAVPITTLIAIYFIHKPGVDKSTV